MGNLQNKWLWAFLLALAAAAGFALALPWGGPALRAVLGIYLVLVGPGLALTTALLPAQRLGTAEHVLAALAASIALAILGGLVLDATPWGLQPISWSVVLGGVTVAASLAALLRVRSAGDAEERGRRDACAPEAECGAWGTEDDAASAEGGALGSSGRVPGLRLALPAAAIVLLGLALYVARIPPAAAGYQGYTTLWLAPNGEQAGARTGARIGVQSGEFDDTSYRLEVRVNGQVANVWPELRLEPNQAWQAQLALPDAGRTAMEVEARLYRTDAPRIVYRQVRFGVGRPGGTDATQSVRN